MEDLLQLFDHHISKYLTLTLAHHISKYLTLTLALRLCGGVEGTRVSFRDAVKKYSTSHNVWKPSPISSAYIMEHDEEVSMVEITMQEVNHLHSSYEKYVVICRFNEYWPPTSALY